VALADLATHRIASFDGVELAVHELGEGRPVLLVHGLFSSAQMNWIKFGHAERLALAGFRVIMPDMRGHGQSAAPHDPALWPAGVLVRDVQAVARALDLADFDLVGFSLGARSVLGAVIGGLAPRKLVLAGMGLESLDNWDRRSAFFVDAIDRFDSVQVGDPAHFVVAFLKTMKIDRVAARLLLQSGGEIDRADLAQVTMSTLVLCGEDDRDNGSPHALAEALPNAQLQLVRGNHMASVTKPDMGTALVAFLGEG